MLARRFLYVVAALIGLILLCGLAWSLYAPQLMRWTFVPRVAFADPGGAPDYRSPAAWSADPARPTDGARWLPAGVARTPPGRAAIFFVAPTTALDGRHWNAAFADPATVAREPLVLTEAAAFSAAGRVWAPRYRQATVGAFLAESADAAHARDLAYGDVLRAFNAFVARAPADAPLILAGHSQGSYHLMRLLRDRIAGRPVARRIVAVYAVGWPVSVAADLPALGLPACTAPARTGCVLSWQSFADPPDAGQLHAVYDASRGLTGALRRGTPSLCVDPLTGRAGGSAPASANLGSLQPDLAGGTQALVRGLVPARCRADGLLDIGEPPAGWGLAILPGNNYHVFDYALFWANVRADAVRRLAAFAP